METGAINKESLGSVGKPKDQQREFSTWLLELPPINLLNIYLIDIYFGKEKQYDDAKSRF
jgi:hypothetical protein